MHTEMSSTTETFLSPEALLEHWQGHRHLTRRTIEAFPEGELFSFTPVDTMRPFGAMVLEIIWMVEPTLAHLLGKGAELPDWSERQKAPPPGKLKLLELWDESDGYIRETWPRVPKERVHAVEAAFGLPPQPNRNLVLYLIDNEIHHRAQGFVYLRLLNLEPPAFWER